MNKNSFIPERFENESQEEYRLRQKQVKVLQRVLTHGRMPTIFVQHNPNQQKKWAEEELIVRDNP